jgi:hypothetical protein
VQFLKRLLELLLCIHHDRFLPSHRLLDWLTRHEQKPNAIVSRLNYNFITAVKEHEGAVVSL